MKKKKLTVTPIKMTDKEKEDLKALYDSLQKAMDDTLKKTFINSNFTTYASNPTQAIHSFPPLPNIPSHNPGSGMSPTDVDAQGMYQYQEPEVDEQGTYYGYKVLNVSPHRKRGCGCEECNTFVSPRYPSTWKNGELEANREPNERSMYGIHFTKRSNHPELRNYYSPFHGSAYYMSHAEEIKDYFLVKCALSGTIVETEQGFRAQRAQIIGVFENGNWTSYQDYQKRTAGYSNPITYEKDTEEWRYAGRWGMDFGSVKKGWTPSADS